MNQRFGREEPASGRRVVDLVGTWQTEERIRVERTKRTELIRIERTREEESIRVMRTEEELVRVER